MEARFPSIGEGHTSRNIAEAPLTQPISGDDDAEMPAAPLAHDIATPRRQVGGRCRKWPVSAQQTADKDKCVACCTICGHSLHLMKRVCNSPIETPNVPAYMLNLSMVELLMIMSHTQNNPRIKTQRTRCTSTSLCHSDLLHRTRIKPPLLLLQKMIRICSAAKRLHDWTKKSWTSSGSTRSRGTA